MNTLDPLTQMEYALLAYRRLRDPRYLDKYMRELGPTGYQNQLVWSSTELADLLDKAGVYIREQVLEKTEV